jgi:hypothetical protein
VHPFGIQDTNRLPQDSKNAAKSGPCMMQLVPGKTFIFTVDQFYLAKLTLNLFYFTLFSWDCPISLWDF